MVCWRKSVERDVLLFVISGAPYRWFGSHWVCYRGMLTTGRPRPPTGVAATGAIFRHCTRIYRHRCRQDGPEGAF
jgi:hypothetical protein